MKIHLMNSAVMIAPGEYSLHSITKREFINVLTRANEAGILESSIGYPQNARLIAAWTGGKVDVPISRKETVLSDGDQMLIMSLRYRTDGYKGRDVMPDDFQFFVCYYFFNPLKHR